MPVTKFQFTLRLDIITHAKIKKIAKIESRSLTGMIKYLINEKVFSYESQNGEVQLTEEDLTIK